MRKVDNSLFITITRTIVIKYILNLYRDLNENNRFLEGP